METFPIAGMGPFIQNLSHIILSCFFCLPFTNPLKVVHKYWWEPVVYVHKQPWKESVRRGQLFCVAIFVYQKMSRFSVFSCPSVQVFEVDTSKLYLSSMSHQKNSGRWYLFSVSASAWESVPAVVAAEELQQQARKERGVSASLSVKTPRYYRTIISVLCCVIFLFLLNI